VSITFKLEIDGHSEALNVSNANAAALLAIAGLQSASYGEIPHERLEAAITKLLRALNSDFARAPAVSSVTEGPRWSEGARTDQYLKRRAGEMMAVLVLARTYGCGVTWG
jgi:hypothetical protein